MKKTLLLLASAAMLLVGCAKEKLGPDAGTSEMVTANFTAQMQGMPQTKSVTDGEGTKANRCVMEIYYKGVFYTRDVQPIEGMKATFTPRLVSKRTYDVLFWADCGGENLADKYYTTDAEGFGLQAVEMKATAYAANDDARDAFYTTESVPVGQQVSSETFTLTRPFAQVNIITTDAAIIQNPNLYPDGVKMVYTAPTKFNLLTGELSKEKALTVTGTPYETFDKTSPALTLEMDYLFAGLEKSVLDIAFEASKTGEATTTHSFANIPVQRNYRTNIKGALLTTTGDWTAEIDPDWEGDIYIDGETSYPVKNVTKGKGYPTLAEAVGDASAGDEITLENGEYTLPSLSNITIEGIGDNVVVNHSSGSICATSNATIKNVVFNLGQSGYHGFQHASNLVLDGCTFNGFMTTYGSTTYKNCTFNQDSYAYNMNAYGAEIVCDNCVFNGKGKAVYVYDEGNGGMYHISFSSCEFNEEVGTGTKCKAAILVKEDYDNQKYVVNINNCIANFDKYVPDDPDLTGSSLWNMELKDGVTGTDVTVNLNNEKVYPFTKFSVSDAAGLRKAVEMFNNSKQAVEHTIIVNDGTYEVSDLLIRKNLSGKSLVMKAANPKGATLKVEAVGEKHYIFKFDGCSSYDETRTTTFEGINFDLSAISGETAVAQSMSGNENRYGAGIIFDGCDLTGGNSMNLNAMYFSSPSNSSPNVVVKNCNIANVGYLASCYAGEFVAEKVITTTNVKHFINNQTSGITTVKNCVVNCNTDYAIRTNGGSISITGSTFNMTYNESDFGGIYVNRRPNAQLTMTGNTCPASYAGQNMHDVYNDPDKGNGGACTISNGSEIITTLQVNEYYDFPRN